jgi:hypothetical protein
MPLLLLIIDLNYFCLIKTNENTAVNDSNTTVWLCKHAMKWAIMKAWEIYSHIQISWETMKTNILASLWVDSNASPVSATYYSTKAASTRTWRFLFRLFCGFTHFLKRDQKRKWRFKPRPFKGHLGSLKALSHLLLPGAMLAMTMFSKLSL